MKKHLKKELVMTKEGDKVFDHSTKCYIRDNDCGIKVRDDRHISGKYSGSARRDFNTNVKLNYKILVVFHNLKNYDSHLIIQELGKSNIEINIIPNGLEMYMSFSINNKLNLLIASNL